MNIRTKLGCLTAAVLVMSGVEGAMGTPIETAGTGYWTNPAAWNPAQVPTLNDDVTILAGHTNTLSTNVAVSIASLTIRTNGALTHLANGTTAQGERYKVTLNITSNLTVDAGGKINVDGKGFAAGNGPGAGSGSYYPASHGGKGGGLVYPSGPTYGYITSPTNLGSGGKSFPGGGAIRLIAGGIATVNGTISAKGGGQSSPDYSPGSGGSVFLTAGTLTGTGTISANGGYGVGYSIGSGGGGRVAVILTNSTDFGAVKKQAYPGDGGFPNGAAGTVYLEHTGHAAGQGMLIVDNNDLVVSYPTINTTLQNGKEASSYSFSEIILTNAGIYALDTNDILDIAGATVRGDPSDRNDGIYLAGGALTIPAAFGFTNYAIAIGQTNATFLPTTLLTVGSNATIKFDVPWTVNYPITLEGGGWMSHTANTTNEAYKINLTVNGNLDIQPNGQVNVDGVGYAGGNGPGKAGQYQCGGSHGGVGGNVGGSPGLTYGSITAPTNCGSGGNGNADPGGGCAQLRITGATIVNGVISSAGMNTDNNSSGGAGGSIFLTTGSLAGNGTIRANGGLGVNNYSSGGGGRIAVILTNSTDFSTVKMQSLTGSPGANGAGGTVYLEHTGHILDQGKLILDYNDLSAGNTIVNTLQNGKESSYYAFSEIVLTNGAVYAVDTNDTLNIVGTVIRGDPSDRNEGIYVAGGTLTVPAAVGFTNFFIAIGRTNSTFHPTSWLTVGTNATMKFDAPWVVDCPVTLEGGGWLSHSPNTTNELNKLNLTFTGDLDIQSNAQVNVDGLGYSMGNGPGSSAARAGGSYGGKGGPESGVARETYGSLTAPTNCGSGGGGTAGFGPGGGAAVLRITGSTTLSGVMTANGVGGNGFAGSGGTVFLVTGALTGNGSCRANGGTGTGGFTSGGGGRIAMILTNASDFGTVGWSAYGPGNAAAGTVYLQSQLQGQGQGLLLIDGSNTVPGASASTLIGSNVTGTIVGTVIITNKAILAINTNQSLTVNGSWTNAGAFIAATNSTVILAGTSAVTMTGSNTFYNLSITDAGKSVSFQAGKTNMVNGLLSLGTTTPGSTVTLKSTIDGSWSYLTLTPTGTQQIARVTVKDSNAGGGQTLLAGKGSVDGGHNVYWVFPKIGGTVIWLQ